MHLSWQSGKDAVRLDPAFAMAFHNRANAKSALANLTAALVDFEQAVTLDPQFDLALYNKACEHAKVEEFEEAIATLERAIQVNSKWRSFAKRDADFDPVHEHPAFQALMQGASPA